MNTSPFLIEETNLSNAWCIALNRIVKARGNEITPLLLTLTDFHENSKVREMVDADLRKRRLATIQTVSETIFPESLYKFCDLDRETLYKEYLNNLPRMKKVDSSNSRGTYFERLIAFEGREGKINQLEIIISSLKEKNIKRRSKLQASIFDPQKDHTNRPYQSFPCLQHVTFYETGNGGLVLNSFYAVQYLYRRAYGNWLGLVNLGQFVARELGLKFERFNCYIGVEHLDELTKAEAENLLKTME